MVRATLGCIGDRLVISEPTTRSRREVPLHPSVVTMLRKHRIAQIAERLRAANKWQNTELVFTTELGGPVDPRNFLRFIETAAISVTGDVYGHSSDATARAAIDGLGARLGL